MIFLAEYRVFFPVPFLISFFKHDSPFQGLVGRKKGNHHCLARARADTAENEPPKVSGKYGFRTAVTKE